MPPPELAPLAVSPAEERQATARKPCAWDLTDQRGGHCQLVTPGKSVRVSAQISPPAK